ncbi:MAG TPA: SDR family NAD(P)-dependent oxidoreductase [Terriglobales bacterium]|nr:SDR family NAD(P)-dependent oxidoreductase [Terriglobales bacterium]
MPADVFRAKSVLITGASSGIGAELARQLAASGARLTLAARRRDRLEAVAREIASAGHPSPRIVVADVTRDGDLEHAVAEALGVHGALDLVIANAGFGVVGSFAKLSLEAYRRQFETNVFGLLRTAHAALPALRASRGQLVLIGSVAGWVSTPGASAYAMSKFAVRALAQAIRPELALDGIRVTLISPGFVASDFRRVDNQGVVHGAATEPIPGWFVMPTSVAVRKILRAVARGRREAVITAHGKALVLLARFAPWTLRLLARRIARSRGALRPEPGP